MADAGIGEALVGGMDVAGGLFGMNLAHKAQQQSDPFAGQRAYYGQQLQQLQANPSSIQKMPGYDAGLQAVERSGAAQGYTGSGNMMANINEYGQNFYDKQFQELANLAGAGATPGANAIPAATMAMLSANRIGNGALMFS